MITQGNVNKNYIYKRNIKRWTKTTFCLMNNSATLYIDKKAIDLGSSVENCHFLFTVPRR